MFSNFTSEYSISISSSKPNESPIYRHPQSKTQMQAFPDENNKSFKDVLLNSFNKFSNRNFLGTKIIDKYQWKNYEKVHEIAINLGSGIENMGIAPSIKEYNDIELRLIGISSKNREEYFLTDFACVLFGLTSVPIYDTMSEEGIEFILTQTKLTTLFLSSETLTKFLKFKNLGSIKNIICFDKINDAESVKEGLKEKNINLMDFDEIIKAGERKIQKYSTNITPKSIYILCYTSGTTGEPKGAILTHENYVAAITAINAAVNFSEKDIHLSYLPLAHVFERAFIWGLLYKGGSIGMYNGDILKLKDDLESLRPTVMATVPRLLNRFHELILSNLEKLTGCKKWLSNKAISTKISNFNKSGSITHCLYDLLVFSKIRSIFGGRLRFIVIGSAPTRRETLEFMKIALSIPIIEGFGQTETTAASIVMRMNDHINVCTIGGPVINIEFKLQNIKEMNYTFEDKDENGKQTPRGELLLRGPGIFSGYYKDQAKTNEVLEKDGWIHTGDVVQLLNNGALKIIDRKKNIFKLAQGEYIAAEKIEVILALCNTVSEIFVYGDSYQNFLVAIVVPKMDKIKEYAEKKKIAGKNEDLLKKKEIRIAVLEEMKDLGKKKKFSGLEFIKNVHLVKDSFANKNLLTTTFKLKRYEAKKIFEKEINSLYEEGMII